MTASIKVTDTSKSRLEELQAEIRLETGRNVTQQELLDRIIATTYESKDELLDSFRDDFEPVSDDEIEAWLSGSSDWEVETTESEIDEVPTANEPSHRHRRIRRGTERAGRTSRRGKQSDDSRIGR